MPSKEDIKIRLKFHRTAAEKLRVAYIALVEGGVQSYSIGSRSLTRMDIPKLMKEIKGHEKAADELEGQLRSGSRRKAVGVVLRDW